MPALLTRKELRLLARGQNPFASMNITVYAPITGKTNRMRRYRVSKLAPKVPKYVQRLAAAQQELPKVQKRGRPGADPQGNGRPNGAKTGH